MFTQLKKGNWNYMFLAAVSSLAVAALATLFSARTENEMSSRTSHDNSEQVVTSRYIQHNETTLRFIN